MNFVEEFFDAIVRALESVANAIEQAFSHFVSMLQQIAHELARFFVRMVKWAARAAHSIGIIILFFVAMALALGCFMEMGYADYWLTQWAGWILFGLTLLLCLAAVLRVFAPSRNEPQRKHHMGVPLVLVNLGFLIAIFVTASQRPLRSPILREILSHASASGGHGVTLVTGPVTRRLTNVVMAARRATVPTARRSAVRRTTWVPERAAPLAVPSCTAPASAGYEPVAVLQSVKAARPPDGGEAAGDVVLKGRVDVEGHAQNLEVSNSNLAREFGVEAIHAVREWRFAPAQLNGRPTECKLTVTVSFEPPKP